MSLTFFFPFTLQLQRGKNSLDLIAQGSRLECQHLNNYLGAWIVTVLENIGGRLRLRYEGLGDVEQYDLWMFYLDPFLHPMGWAAQQGYILEPPLGTKFNFQSQTSTAD